MSKETEKEKPHSVPPRPTATEAKGVIYLGAGMIEDDFLIQYGQVFSNGLPENIKKRMQENSEFAKMFVPIGDAPRAMRELQNKHSDLFISKDKLSKEYIERKKQKRGK
jgi:hypothetical protein